MVVERKETRGKIVLIFLLEVKRVRKLLQVFQRMMLKQRGVSMHSGLEGRSWVMVMMMSVSPFNYTFVIWVPSKWESMVIRWDRML